ncbi:MULTISPECIES: FtsW/RodA/SpoVE family cell cycle protein [Arthrobacter]|uniref:Cell division protein n=1 Tax=Arthrobacter psychrochitiniphilus TaxID=291045 RepID=A0A2V3DRK1_9MICC|nr:MULTISPECIES: FtsW/RodA/SpoVE family cell cycle protein [Arthrobacter]NYG19246.1 cell division protein FtsW (lipid II flippase) [Arthrobacter psychrochitiniphilus]PXA65817.1 cell division protein [Arthrobacter psychrochitiniphilus]
MSQLLTVAKPRRNTELLLLILALGVSAMANALVNLNLGRTFDNDFFTQIAILSGLSLAFHVVLRFKAKYADPVILPVVVALNGIGLAVIHRLDITSGDTAATRQWMWTSLAVVAAITVIWFLRDHRILRRYTYISLLVSVVLLILPLVPGISAGNVNGATVWISLGPFTFQPGEIAKITLAIFFAGYLSSNRDLILLAGKKIGPLQLPRMRDMAPMIVAWLASVGVLVFQRDLGSSILFFGLFMVMIYVATSRVSWIFIGLALIAVGGVAAYQIFPHVARRIDVWVNAFDPAYIGADYGSFQVVEGLFGLANGGLMGTGLGQGSPDKLPVANSDMIIAVIGEELGLVGLFAILCLYALLIARGFRAALGTRDAFGKLLAVGLSFAVALQCFIIIGGVTRLIPLTGLTTPFLSSGGSSLLANWIIVALILKISDAARRPIDVSASSSPIEQLSPIDATQKEVPSP